MTIQIATISQELWLSVTKSASGGALLNSQSSTPNSSVSSNNQTSNVQTSVSDKLVFPSENNKDWLFKICGIYDKGKTSLLLCSIPTPGVKYLKLTPLTDSDWQSAFVKANQILFDLFKLPTPKEKLL
jgi:hypothetical protein